MPREFTSPVGRIVQGSVWKLETTDSKAKPIIVKSGPNAGQPGAQTYISLAIAKDNPDWPAFQQMMFQEAREGWAEFFDAQGNCTHRDFSWKYRDGDGSDRTGQSYAAREGWAGHHIITFSGAYLPRCYPHKKYGPGDLITDERMVKRGDFVRVAGVMKGNRPSETPGLYLNHNLIELMYVGTEIVSGPDAGATFGAAQPSTYVPQGAIALGASHIGQGGTMGGGMQQGGGMGQPQGGPAAGGMGGMQQGGSMGGPGGMPGSNVQPNHGFVQGAMGGPAAGGGMGAPAGGGMPFSPNGAQQRQPVMTPTPKAAGYTLQQFYDNGFNDQQLIEQGFFVLQ